ncbi:2,3-diaminopropionate biosynthesis protein SbnA [Portibacter lacus]|uniref:N-(2-amino-2-carboxyethyl)-L-glutamate synthase n=1 Tax=Portibacter lacus TaxID=1099794 RepID=A0AA37WFT0_9BACT|nr:2,3-diaminopropionate biosynthesis protein SbnA [Portibacter lacus]GLR17999.1 2,3-diaminopropionate biosynthesis protein SbnA [Portibacter lacus]
MGILTTVGNTPQIKLENSSEMLDINLYAKLEFLNPAGSIKDRTSLSILEHALSSGEINENSTIIESSSGNMAIGIAQFCRYHKLKLIIVVDPFALETNIKIIKAYGARVIKVEKPSPLTGWLGARINIIQKLLKESGDMYWPNQYKNKMNPMAHYQTMKEFHNGLDAELDYVFIATSTCGTLMGCSKFIREQNLNTKLIAVDAKGSVIFSNKPGKRVIPGHGASKPSQLLDKSQVDGVVLVSDYDCVSGCQNLLTNEGIFAGGSSGGVYTAINRYASNIKPGSRCGMLICDRGERYLDTIYDENWVKENIASEVETMVHAA